MWPYASLVVMALVVSACGVTAVDSDEAPGDGMLAGVNLELHKAPD